MKPRASILLSCTVLSTGACDHREANPGDPRAAEASPSVADAWMKVARNDQTATHPSSATPVAAVAPATKPGRSPALAVPAAMPSQPRVTDPVPPTPATPATEVPLPSPVTKPIVAPPSTPDVKLLPISVPTPATVVEGDACHAPPGSYGARPPLALHRDGAFQFEAWERGKLAVVGCDGERRSLAAAPRVRVWTSDPAGNLYFAYVQRIPGTASGELVVTKLDPAGELVWTQAKDTGQTATVPNVIRADAAGVRVAGAAGGQLPGNPPAAHGQPWVLGYEHDGKLRSFEQWSGDLAPDRKFHPAEAFELADIDAAGNLYLVEHSNLGTLALHQVDAAGRPQWSAERRSPCHGPRQLQVRPEGDAIYYVGIESSAGAWRSCVARLDGDGNPVWARTLAPRHEVVVDPVEGTKWLGRAGGNGTAYLAVGDASLFVVGQYDNHHELGATPPPAFESLWVVELGFDGELRETRHVRVGPLEMERGETGSRSSYTPVGATVLATGELQVVGVYQASPRTKGKHVVLTLPAGQPAPSSVRSGWLGRALSKQGK